ncbi:MAG: hypothetical protein KDC34_07710 [Saprospiraceae bacterium]|nr:hypothetical protein [Saprospiraceae bacterium]
MKFIFFPIFLCLLAHLHLFGQESDSLQIDSLQPKIVLDSTLVDSLLVIEAASDSLSAKRHYILNYKADPDYPKPKTALLLSLAVPGAGQFYNGKWWKIPIVYGALGGLGYLVDRNSTDYLQLKRAHRRILRGVPHDFTGTYLDNKDNLKSLRDQVDKNRQLSYVGFVVVYVLNGAEAFVNAHLAHFDIDDDLSLKLEPTMLDTPFGPTPSIGLMVDF